MSINKYEALVKIVELGSLTRAAESLGYTQSGMSYMINSLEEEWGFPLLVRRKSGIRLTANGEKLMPSIRQMINCNERLMQEVALIQGIKMGTIRIGTFTSISVHWVPGMIKSFQKEYPEIEFELMHGDYRDMERLLVQGQVDCSFVALPPHLDYDYVELFKDRMLAIMPTEHRFANLEKFPLPLVEQDSFIALNDGADYDMRHLFEEMGLHPSIKFSAGDDHAIISMVSIGLGISILPELVLIGNTNDLKVMELEESCYRSIGIGVRSTEESSPATKRFIKHAQNWIKEHSFQMPL